MEVKGDDKVSYDNSPTLVIYQSSEFVGNPPQIFFRGVGSREKNKRWQNILVDWAWTSGTF